jgi:hypothetical protein
MTSPPNAAPIEPDAPSPRFGLALLGVYLPFFAGFLYLHMFHPAAMAAATLPLSPTRELELFGTNLAVLYGAALVVVGVLFAFTYLYTSSPPRSERP